MLCIFLQEGYTSLLITKQVVHSIWTHSVEIEIHSVLPSTGPIAGGTEVELRGSNVEAGSLCKFG